MSGVHYIDLLNESVANLDSIQTSLLNSDKIIVNEIEINKDIIGDLIPSIDCTYDIGSLTNQWKDGYICGVMNANNFISKGHSAFGASSVIQTNSVINVDETVTSGNESEFVGYRSKLIVDPQTILNNSTKHKTSFQSDITFTGSNYGLGAFIKGAEFSIKYTGTNSGVGLLQTTALEAGVYVPAGGHSANIHTANGLLCSIGRFNSFDQSSTLSLQNAYNLRILGPDNGATITNLWGLYVNMFNKGNNTKAIEAHGGDVLLNCPTSITNTLSVTGNSTLQNISISSFSSNLIPTISTLDIGSISTRINNAYFNTINTNNIILNGDITANNITVNNTLTVLGNSSLQDLSITSISSNIIPTTGTQNIGSLTNRLNNGYFNNIDVLNISLGGSDITANNITANGNILGNGNLNIIGSTTLNTLATTFVSSNLIPNILNLTIGNITSPFSNGYMTQVDSTTINTTNINSTNATLTNAAITNITTDVTHQGNILFNIDNIHNIGAPTIKPNHIYSTSFSGTNVFVTNAQVGDPLGGGGIIALPGSLPVLADPINPFSNGYINNMTSTNIEPAITLGTSSVGSALKVYNQGYFNQFVLTTGFFDTLGNTEVILRGNESTVILFNNNGAIVTPIPSLATTPMPITRNGNMVTLTLPNLSTKTTIEASNKIVLKKIPVGYRPIRNLSFHMRGFINDGGGWRTFLLIINTNGIIKIYSNLGGGFFVTGRKVKWNAMSISYNLAVVI